MPKEKRNLNLLKTMNNIREIWNKRQLLFHARIEEISSDEGLQIEKTIRRDGKF